MRLRLSEERSVWVPGSMLEALGLAPGDEVDLRLEGRRLIITPVDDLSRRRRALERLQALKGSADGSAPGPSSTDVHAGTRRQAAVREPEPTAEAPLSLPVRALGSGIPMVLALLVTPGMLVSIVLFAMAQPETDWAVGRWFGGTARRVWDMEKLRDSALFAFITLSISVLASMLNFLQPKRIGQRYQLIFGVFSIVGCFWFGLLLFMLRR